MTQLSPAALHSIAPGEVSDSRTRILRPKARHIYRTEEGKRAFGYWTEGRGRDEFVFTQENGAQWGTHDQHRPMSESRDGAELGTDVTFHALKHTYASILVKPDVNLSVVAHSLGHADTRMVEKHYGHLAPSHVAQVIRANLPSFGVNSVDIVRAPSH